LIGLLAGFECGARIRGGVLYGLLIIASWDFMESETSAAVLLISGFRQLASFISPLDMFFKVDVDSVSLAGSHSIFHQ
jgi:hypothetical protein